MSGLIEPEGGGRWLRYGVTVGVGGVVLVLGYALFHFISSDTSAHKRVVETVTLKLIAPPPPPKVERPPDSPKMVEQPKIREPIDKPDDKPKDVDKPPPGPLALDAKGGPGSDAFGLGGKPGGADFVGGSGGGGDGFRHYATVMADRIQQCLTQDDKLDVGKFRGVLRVWVAGDGRARAEILHSTGEPAIDDRIRQDIAGNCTMTEAPPPEMKQPVVVRVGGHEKA